MSNVSTTPTTFKAIIQNHFFTRGYKDVMAGKGFDPEYETWPYRREAKFRHAQWSYERGRQFAAATQGKIPTKCGRGNKEVNWDAIVAFRDLYRENAII
jgi:hypothetical protein